MDPGGFVCAGSTRRSHLTGLVVVIIQCLETQRAFLFSSVRSLRGQIWSAVGGQQTGSSVRPVILNTQGGKKELQERKEIQPT